MAIQAFLTLEYQVAVGQGMQCEAYGSIHSGQRGMIEQCSVYIPSSVAVRQFMIVAVI